MTQTFHSGELLQNLAGLAGEYLAGGDTAADGTLRGDRKHRLNPSPHRKGFEREFPYSQKRNLKTRLFVIPKRERLNKTMNSMLNVSLQTGTAHFHFGSSL